MVRERIRICDETAVTGLCTDCGQTVAGKLGLRAVLRDHVWGIEVMICEERNMHPIAAVPLRVLPLLEDES